MIHLIVKDKIDDFQFAGKCKITIDPFSQILFIEPEIEEFKLISATFKWKFVAQKNIILVFAEHNFQDFGLIFKNEKLCKKVCDILIKKEATEGYKGLVKERFSIFMDISKIDETILKMKEKFVEWIKENYGKEKAKYIHILKQHNLYNLIFSNGDGNTSRILRKRKCPTKNFEADEENHDSDVNELLSRDGSSSESYDEETDSENPPSKKAKLSKNFHNSNSQKIIVKPNFEYLEYQHLGIIRKRLFIFYTNDKTKCYEYYWCTPEKVFSCCGCARKMKKVRAEICQKLNGTKYVKLGQKEHVCEMREYQPEKYIYDPSTDIVQKPNFKLAEYMKRGIQKSNLIIFCPTNKNLCYEYTFSKDVKKYYCLECRKAAKAVIVSAKIEKNENGEDCVILNKTQHVCDLREFNPEKYKSDIVIPKNMFEFFENTVYGKISTKLLIFTSTEKKMCHIFFNNRYSFSCRKCCSLNAMLCKNDNGEEYISLQDKKHVCQPYEYSTDLFKDKIKQKVKMSNIPKVVNPSKIIKAPNFQLIKRRRAGEWFNKLIVLTSDDKKLCYEYSWDETHKHFICRICKHNSMSVSAKVIRNEGNEEYVVLGEREHICKPREYIPEDLNLKILKKTDYKIESLIIRGNENQYLFVNDKTDKNLWYRYCYYKDKKRFYCNFCKTCCVSAILHHADENREEYIELSNAEHDCQPKPIPESKIINLPNFKIDTDGKNQKHLIIFDKNDKTLCYIYNNRKAKDKFFCKKCNTFTYTVNATLRKNQNGEDYIELGKNDHLCKPEKYLKQQRLFV
uniref:Uncharacterized protein n=1 Tax=Panagrolaimus sp. ES5 TaxID=591445 RepID=A0AC34GUY7_9BILA